MPFLLYKEKTMDKEKELAALYGKMVKGASQEQEVITLFAQMIYQVIQKIIFQAAREQGYDMDKLKVYLDKAMKEYIPQEENN